jgi:hypothetical protein
MGAWRARRSREMALGSEDGAANSARTDRGTGGKSPAGSE